MESYPFSTTTDDSTTELLGSIVDGFGVMISRIL